MSVKSRASYKRRPVIENYVETLVPLPSQIVKGMNLIRKLDMDVEEGIEVVEEAVANDPKSISEEDIRNNFKHYLTLSDEKIAISNKLLNILETHIEDCHIKIEALEDNIQKSSKRRKKHNTRRSSRNSNTSKSIYNQTKKYGEKKKRKKKKRPSSTPASPSNRKSRATSGRKRKRDGRVVQKTPYQSTKSIPRTTAVPAIRSKSVFRKKGRTVAPPPTFLPRRSSRRNKGKGSEEVFCYCNGGSFGDMIECENPSCTRKWFHFRCVGIEKAPDSNQKWFCDDCKRSMKL